MVLDRGVIDAIGYLDTNETAYLMIFDHLEWDKDILDEHFQILQDKLNDYFMFIQTGQVEENFDKNQPFEIKNYTIFISFLHPPTRKAKYFLHEAQKTAKKIHTKIQYYSGEMGNVNSFLDLDLKNA